MSNKDAYYFSHDSNALTDPKILSMRCDYGLEGYGLYWAILEMLRNESTYKLTLNKNTYRAIKMQTNTNIDVEKFIDDCINEYKDSESGDGLFNSKDGVFWSESFLKRMKKYENLKEKRRQAANSRWNKNNQDNKREETNTKNEKQCKCIKFSCKNNANAKHKKYKCNAKSKKTYAKLCKLNKIKLNKIKLNKIKSIYQSDLDAKTETIEINKILMDEMEKMEYENVIEKCELHVLEVPLALEIKAIIKEMYMNLKTREKILELNSKQLLYALDNFAEANTKSNIKKPKAYFEKCLLSAINETELSNQFSLNGLYNN